MCRYSRFHSTFKAIIHAASALIVMGGCAASGPAYQPARDAGGYGYSERQLTADRYVVQFVAKDHQSAAARDYALLRAAELTLQKGHAWFEVADRSTDTHASDRSGHVGIGYTRPMTTTHTNCGLLACSSRTYVDPGVHGHVEHAPARSAKVAVSLEVRLGTGKRPECAGCYDAAELADTLRSNLRGA